MKDLITTVQAAWKLARFQEYYGTVFLITLVGVLIIQPVSFVNIALIMLANFFNYAFAFMINDIEDAEDDAKCEIKIKRNPVAGKIISVRKAYTVSWIVAISSLLLYLSFGKLVFLYGLLGILLGFLYSWKKVRLKSKPFIDIISHGLFLGTLNFIAAAMVGEELPSLMPILWFGLIFFTFSALGDINNELRDLKVDTEVGLKNTASIFGGRILGGVLKYLTVLPGIGLAVSMFLFTSMYTQIAIVLILCVVGVHYIMTDGFNIRGLYKYKYRQSLYVALGLALILAPRIEQMPIKEVITALF